MDPVTSQLIGAGGRRGLGQTTYSNRGTFTFVVPSEVFEISIVTIGAGGGSDVYPDSNAGSGGGGALAYVNNVPVSPGQSVTVTVGRGGAAGSIYTYYGSDPVFPSRANPGTDGGSSKVVVSGVTVVEAGGGKAPINGASGGTVIIGTGGAGGAGRTNSSSRVGGGGAGGYSGAGGQGGANFSQNGANGAGGGSGGGGAGGSSDTASTFRYFNGGAGGKTGVQGQGTNGAGGIGQEATGGGAGGNGSPIGTVFAGGGAGGGLFTYFYSTDRNVWYGASAGANGAVRIIWGAGRAFPSTNTGDV